ncbi:LytTR family DNA-binding domain-containing protein [Lutibacter sp.]|uniref:LytR/AlgR family response regulator transcription factor n=1 Tax=Lutibacter sp. TaxID=1925666 RepID=UPI002736F3D9|nr:LytTR family DNA-binding domain-containing protein [Lutibacter sp.]MDP3314218.1 LytTR family DNA-binding domain-containing protein [Lutibacter sp.]
MINAIIIEDESSSYNHLKQILDFEYGSSIIILGHATGVKSGIKLINDMHPELVFLDIQLEDGTGFELLDFFSNTATFEVIFTTGLRDYKEKAMDYFAFYYLNKPIQQDQLTTVIDRFLSKKSAFDVEKYFAFKNQIENKSKKISLPIANGDFIILDLDEIIYCEADGSYTHFFTINNKTYTTSNNLKKVETILNNTTFFRIHRSTLLNLKHIKQFNTSGEIKLSNDKKLIVSSRNKALFLKTLKQLNYSIN